jgi:hypothetical protein
LHPPLQQQLLAISILALLRRYNRQIVHGDTWHCQPVQYHSVSAELLTL